MDQDTDINDNEFNDEFNEFNTLGSIEGFPTDENLVQYMTENYQDLLEDMYKLLAKRKYEEAFIMNQYEAEKAKKYLDTIMTETYLNKLSNMLSETYAPLNEDTYANKLLKKLYNSYRKERKESTYGKKSKRTSKRTRCPKKSKRTSKRTRGPKKSKRTSKKKRAF